MNKAKLYRTLGLKPGASPKEVRKSFRRLARRYHPDMSPRDPDAQRKFILVWEAYEALMSVEPEGERAAPARGPEPWGPRVARDTAFSIFEAFGIETHPGFGRSGPGVNLRFELEISPTKAAKGCVETISYSRSEVCICCSGNRELPQGVACPFCDGDGLVMALKSVGVEIPPGSQDGTRLVIKGGGEAGPGGGAPGDLVVVVHVADSASFPRTKE